MKLNKAKVIGLTGGIATGKSTVSNILKDKGYIVIDADQIAREVVQIGEESYYNIIDSFGKEYLNEDKTINRKKLGKMVFSDNEKLKLLNELTHPQIFKRIRSEIEKSIYIKKEIFVDIPLLYEELDEINSYNIYFDEIWFVYLDREEQKNRLMKRDNVSEEEALIKINAQMSMEEKLKLSKVVIDNSLDVESLTKKIENLLEKL